MLQISVILFVIGLIFFLLEVDKLTATVVTVMIVLYAGAFVYTLVIPCTVERSPYRTQLVIYLRNAVHLLHSWWKILRDMLRHQMSWKQATQGMAFYGRYDWVYRDQLRSKLLSQEANYDPLVSPLFLSFRINCLIKDRIRHSGGFGLNFRMNELLRAWWIA